MEEYWGAGLLERCHGWQTRSLAVLEGVRVPLVTLGWVIKEGAFYFNKSGGIALTPLIRE